MWGLFILVKKKPPPKLVLPRPKRPTGDSKFLKGFKHYNLFLLHKVINWYKHSQLTYLGIEGRALSPSAETKWKSEWGNTTDWYLMLEVHHHCKYSFAAIVIFRGLTKQGLVVQSDKHKASSATVGLDYCLKDGWQQFQPWVLFIV